MKRYSAKSFTIAPVWNFNRGVFWLPVLLLISFFCCRLYAGGDGSETTAVRSRIVKSEPGRGLDGGNYADNEDNLPQEMLRGNSLRGITLHNGSNLRGQTRKVQETLILACFSLILPESTDSACPLPDYPAHQYSNLLKKSLPVRAGPFC